MLMWMLLCGSRLRLLSVCNRAITRGNGFSKLGPWLVWCQAEVPHSVSWTTLVCHFTTHKPWYNILGSISPGFKGISLSIGDLLDTLVCEVESSLGAKGEVCDEHYLQEVVECIVALRNVALLG
jgi:hypothetical protein